MKKINLLLATILVSFLMLSSCGDSYNFAEIAATFKAKLFTVTRVSSLNNYSNKASENPWDVTAGPNEKEFPGQLQPWEVYQSSPHLPDKPPSQPKAFAARVEDLTNSKKSLSVNGTRPSR